MFPINNDIYYNSPKSLSNILQELFSQTNDDEYITMYKEINKRINKRMESELNNRYKHQVFGDITAISCDDYPIWVLRDIYLRTWQIDRSKIHLKKLISGSNGEYTTFIPKGAPRNRYKHARDIGSKNLNRASHLWGCSGCGICASDRRDKLHQKKKERIARKQINHNDIEY